MATVQIFRETALPGMLQANSIYFIAPAAKPDYVEVYITGTSAATVKRVIDEDDVNALISTAISGLSSIQVVADITARNAIEPKYNGLYALVLDATGDVTVGSGAASYIYNASAWIKVHEYESLDLSFTWAALQNKPSSSVADIDDAVAKKHTHANKTQLDKINEDGNGNFTYNDALPKIAWATTGW